eukprot:782351-Alexandrium_andersonii.AAC.1
MGAGAADLRPPRPELRRPAGQRGAARGCAARHQRRAARDVARAGGLRGRPGALAPCARARGAGAASRPARIPGALGVPAPPRGRGGVAPAVGAVGVAGERAR